MNATALIASALLLREGDNVAVATHDLSLGEQITVGGREISVRATVPRGHKVAITAVPSGEKVLKYGQSIGRATRDISPGDHVHVHNLGMDDVEGTYEFAVARVVPPVPEGERPTFLGYRRANGKVGTRNYVAIVTSVNCSASTARLVADQFPRQRARRLPAH